MAPDATGSHVLEIVNNILRPGDYSIYCWLGSQLGVAYDHIDTQNASLPLLTVWSEETDPHKTIGFFSMQTRLLPADPEDSARLSGVLEERVCGLEFRSPTRRGRHPSRATATTASVVAVLFPNQRGPRFATCFTAALAATFAEFEIARSLRRCKEARRDTAEPKRLSSATQADQCHPTTSL